jgi:HlyD family secretion protein
MLSIIRKQLAELIGLEARLVAERDGADAIRFPDGFERGQPGGDVIARGETRLFQGNLEKRRSHVEQLELQIVQLAEEVNGLNAQAAAKTEEMALVAAEREKIRALAEKGYAERTRVYAVDRELIRMVGERAEITAGIARAQGRISEIRLQIISINDTARTEAQAELRSVTAKISELRERRTAVEDRLARTEIRAPLSGVVNELAVHTVSGVITPAQKILTIVPEGADLKVEVKLAPTDVDQVFVGQRARLRFSSFNQRTTPEIEGRISHVPAAATQDGETKQPFYRGTLEIVGDLRELGDVELLPGMPVEVFVETQELTAISYLAKPLSDQINRAFREE